MKKVTVGILVVGISFVLSVSTSFAAKGPKYEGGAGGGGSISGSVSFKGDVPAPIMEDLSKGKNVEFCITHPEAKGNIRARQKVVVSGGKLKDTVVFIETITKGKDWPAKMVNFEFKTCDIFPKVAVTRKSRVDGKKLKTGLMTITNLDPDILHNPHGYAVAGPKRQTLFNKPLPSKGDVADVTKNLLKFKKTSQNFFLQCDQHNYMEADAKVVWNPYFSISGADGTFKIDGIPAGKYKVTAWHPYAGESTQEITVGDGDVKADFTIGK